jgi:AraC-like DNA-binding protein
VNINLNLNNDFSAKLTGLATNSFTRLYTSEVGSSPQNFIKEKKIAKACVLLDHTEMRIDKIFQHLGFSDRYHFTLVLKNTTENPSLIYRKGMYY